MAMAFAARLAAVLAAIARAWESPTGTPWQRSILPPWDAHTGSISVSKADGSVLLLGGQKGEHGGALFDCFNCTNEVWNFEPSTETWMDLSADVPWEPRWGHSAVATADGTVWMLFGCCERGKPAVMLRDVWTYNPAKGVPWTQMDTVPPFEGVQATSIAVYGDDLWVVAGWSQSRGTLSQVAVLSSKTLQWTVKSDHGQAPWKHRADHATAISPDGKWLILYAGQHRDEKTGHWMRLKDTWRVSLPDAKPGDWEQLGDLNAARSSVPVAILPSGWLLSLGGHWVPEDEELKAKQEDTEAMIDHHRKMTFHTYNDVLALDLKNGGKDGWKVVEDNAPWEPRDDCAGGVLTDGSLIIFGGGTLYGGGGYLQDVWRLPDPTTFYRLGGSPPSDEL
mmetsp:Transcript_80345/g.247747  ORF Transcript_80345/g.247747 Transcript_80345/m.247747 type:complete len:393 (-) Transcript_80345:66-1244(-)